ncbi:DUF1338 domain-containing protein [Moraxella caviae]|uniref:2-oxoadipate dioxygenase/decarboxylase n=1 Tax=Moraxella caviae TaxID=34060 RepID=A0A1S9ZZE9_9GAMM|nr:VOC family protein [Moraxella caviae]OOR88874.1 DUF1338 domain-containing protein [Moraxella caviae]STZ10234.1 Uncharacterized protein conserved in bacteria [Moraxella caviae]
MSNFLHPNEIRHKFSLAMSQMYQKEVPLYKDLMDLVADVNEQTLSSDVNLKSQLAHTGELERIDLERHGAIRLGLPSELATMRRLFAVMGMLPVGYYDLAPAGVPVHSTAFRATDSKALQHSPFRVFCSLLRLELIADKELRDHAEATLKKRQIFSEKVLALIDKCEREGGLDADDAHEFVQEATKTFQWHATSPIAKNFYDKLHQEHRLIADVVGFYGPHINHLTPRTLDIDAVQAGMSARNIPPKAIIEGPPRRQCPILLRQTSFKALQEPIAFQNADGTLESGHHTARFGEIEQRGVALTPKGRALYDALLAKARQNLDGTPESNPEHYYQALSESFKDFADDYRTLHDEGLAYFYYQLADDYQDKLQNIARANKDVPTLIQAGVLRLEPIVYEDFLPVSAAGIFQSNLGDKSTDDADDKTAEQALGSQAEFEAALGAKVHDEFALYQAMMDESLQSCLAALA